VTNNRTRHSFKHADLAERLAAIAIAREMGMSEIDAWRRYVEYEELPQFFHDLADQCGEESENYVDDVLAREERERKTAAADVSSKILRSGSERPADDNAPPEPEQTAKSGTSRDRE